MLLLLEVLLSYLSFRVGGSGGIGGGGGIGVSGGVGSGGDDGNGGGGGSVMLLSVEGWWCWSGGSDVGGVVACDGGRSVGGG